MGPGAIVATRTAPAAGPGLSSVSTARLARTGRIAAVLRPISGRLRRLLRAGRLQSRGLLSTLLTVVPTRLHPVLPVLPVPPVLSIRVELGPRRRRGDSAGLHQERQDCRNRLEHDESQHNPQCPTGRIGAGLVKRRRDHQKYAEYPEHRNYRHMALGLRHQSHPGKQRSQQSHSRPAAQCHRTLRHHLRRVRY